MVAKSQLIKVNTNARTFPCFNKILEKIYIITSGLMVHNLTKKMTGEELRPIEHCLTMTNKLIIKVEALS